MVTVVIITQPYIMLNTIIFCFIGSSSNVTSNYGYYSYYLIVVVRIGTTRKTCLDTFFSSKNRWQNFQLRPDKSTVGPSY